MEEVFRHLDERLTRPGVPETVSMSIRDPGLEPLYGETRYDSLFARYGLQIEG